MGANNSISTINSKVKIKEDIDSLLNYLLSQHIENFLDKSFCKKTKLFIKDKIFMKHAEEDIKDVSNEIFIGKEISDLSKKKELCDKLANYYLKKLNMVSSIDYTLKFYYEKLDKLQSGPFCFSEKKGKISNLIYDSEFTKSTIIRFNQKQSIQLPSKHSIKITDKDIRDEAYEQYLTELKKRNMNNHISSDAKKNLLVTELNHDQCSDKNHKWLNNKTNMIENNLIPNPKLKEYNKSFKNIIDKLVQFMNNKTKELFSNLAKIVSKDEKGNYSDKAISDKEINDIISSTQKIIKNIFIEINKAILLVTNITFISEEEIKNQESLESTKKQIEERIKNHKKSFYDSNI